MFNWYTISIWKMKMFWKWMVLIPQCDCTKFHRTAYLQMLKMVNFMLYIYILPQEKNI